MFVEETPSFGYHDRSPSKSKWWTLWHHCSELLVENSDNVLAKEDCLWSCGCDRGCWLWFQLESVYCRFLARSRPGRRLNMSLQLFSFYEPLVSLEAYCPRNWWISFFFRLIKGCCMTIYRYGMFLEIEKFKIFFSISFKFLTISEYFIKISMKTFQFIHLIKLQQFQLNFCMW